jgi:iron only hydrogenase large subunit-like protein/nitrogen-specific signal transduction histidine kinase
MVLKGKDDNFNSKALNRKELVTTIKEKCRVCFTCVRECPAKAIKIVNGQAEIIQERCIGCGNCVKVCSQEAKVFLNTTDVMLDLINSNNKVAAIIAPSFPAEFSEIKDYKAFVGMLRKIGFDYVHEVAFGADLVSLEYQKILENENLKTYISADCPAIVSYVEKYYPQIIESLAPIVSPMIAMTRVVKEKYGNETKVVFVGPCIAKKDESKEVDAAITFKELRDIFEEKDLFMEKELESEFNQPIGGKGGIFPVSRGLIQTLDIDDTIHEGNVIVAEGRSSFPEAIREFDSGLIDDHHLELLCCEGCIMGAGMSVSGNRFLKRTNISNFVQQRLDTFDKEEWKNQIEKYSTIDLSASYKQQDQRLESPSPHEIQKVLETMGKFDPKDMLNCGACGYETCEEHAIAIIRGFAENEMCLPFTIEKLHESIENLNVSNDKLATARQALKQSEKLAHMGQLSAGIAHELNNPLGVVIMYANILLEEHNQNTEMKEDLELIVKQAERCKNIVGDLLNFARKNQVRYNDVNLVDLLKSSLESVIIPDNVKTSLHTRISDPIAEIDEEQMMQVLTNLNRNAFEAMPNGGELVLSLIESKNEIIIRVKDSGTGIPKENMEKLFTPFYTTKGIGKGTGLGLATTYGVVKMHKGKIEVESNDNPEKGPTGTTFIIILPKH